jgi:hypothetical protein
MLNKRKLIPFALAAGMMAGTAAAQDSGQNNDLEYIPPADQYSCEQWRVPVKEGVRIVTQDCTGNTARVLGLNHAMAEKDWAAAYDFGMGLQYNGVDEEDVVAKTAQAGFMMGSMPAAEEAARIASEMEIRTPYVALINAILAVKDGDLEEAKAVMDDIPQKDGDPATIFVRNTLYMLAKIEYQEAQALDKAPKDVDSKAEKYLWTAVRAAQEDLQAQIDAIPDKDGDGGYYKDAAREIKMMRHMTELALSPGYGPAMQGMAAVYGGMGKKNAILPGPVPGAPAP